MSDKSFLDTGVVLAFCYTTDKHHFKCREYIDSEDCSMFVSDNVEDEYENARYRLNEQHANAVLSHVSDLRNSKYEGEYNIGPVKQKEIRDNVLCRGNEVYQFLSKFYTDYLPQFVTFDELESKLRNLARDIESVAVKRKSEIDEFVEIWSRKSDHPNVEKNLSSIHTEDREICIDAHDLAANSDGATEIATTNPNDFVRNGHKQLILENTELSDVVSLAVTT
ncbi:hypothetical protein [Halogeometricum borinquense]|uniref:hypothetical protein n=1 Tax=Halogeometricum borinquense TaxID=60847 RepID=UPI0034291AE4